MSWKYTSSPFENFKCLENLHRIPTWNLQNVSKIYTESPHEIFKMSQKFTPNHHLKSSKCLECLHQIAIWNLQNVSKIYTGFSLKSWKCLENIQDHHLKISNVSKIYTEYPPEIFKMSWKFTLHCHMKSSKCLENVH